MSRRSRKDILWHPHDRFVQVCLSVPAIAAPLIRGACPAAVADAVDWATLRLEPTVFKSIGTDQAAESRSDLLYSACWRQSQLRIYFQIEHVSRGRMPSAVRLQGYREGLRRNARPTGDHNDTVPFLLQILLMQGRSPVKVRRYQLTLAARNALGALASGPTLEPLVRLIDVPAKDDTALYVARPDAIFLLILKSVRQATVMLHLPVILKHISTLEPFAHSIELRDAVLAYLLCGVPEIDNQPYAQIIELHFPSIEAPTMKTVGEILLEEGYEEGLREGEVRGEARGEARGLHTAKRDALLLILRKRFGSISDQQRARIDGADLDQLQLWTEAALDAASVHAVFAEK